MNKLEKKQTKVIWRRFIKRFDKDFGWYTFEIVKNDKGDFALNYTLGINYIISSGSEGIDNLKTLSDLFEMEVLGLEDVLLFNKQELELATDKHYNRSIKADIRLMKALITFFNNAKKYVEVK